MKTTSLAISPQGFTLLELMIVVAIISILSVIAVPAYQQYTVRAHIAEILSFGSNAKLTLLEDYSARGSMPPANSGIVADTIALLLASQFVAKADYRVDTTHRAIIELTTQRLGASTDGLRLNLYFEALPATLIFTCGSTDLPATYLPSACRD